jgi:hypothetical protein
MASANLDQWINTLRCYEYGASYTDEQVANLPYRNWGFTIYRTYYGPTSQQAWETLLSKITLETQESAEEMTDSDADDSEFQQMMSLFRLDARSDEGTLSGLDMDQLRAVYRDRVGGMPMNADFQDHYQLFLLADEEVLADPELEMVKCVEFNYDAAQHVPRNSRLGGAQRYFGWMKMKVETVPYLWNELGYRTLDSIAPQTIAGMHLEAWEGD